VWEEQQKLRNHHSKMALSSMFEQGHLLQTLTTRVMPPLQNNGDNFSYR
tara:strand:+ start:462280 stop:462426 length:147 start_codon:yes stop_codon:yes gene_type:complete